MFPPCDTQAQVRHPGGSEAALPSLGAVGRLTIISRIAGEDAAEITVSGGAVSAVKPAGLNTGTVITLRDLFYATPARLKFLRTDRAEAQRHRQSWISARFSALCCNLHASARPRARPPRSGGLR